MGSPVITPLSNGTDSKNVFDSPHPSAHNQPSTSVEYIVSAIGKANLSLPERKSLISLLEVEYKQDKAAQKANNTGTLMQEINRALRDMDHKMEARARHDEKVVTRLVRLEDTVRKTEETLRKVQDDTSSIAAAAAQNALDTRLTKVDVASLKLQFEQASQDMETTCERIAQTVGLLPPKRKSDP